MKLDTTHYGKALNLANQIHFDQTRWNGDPYIFHPLRVSNAQTTLFHKIIGLLHDVIEDCDSVVVEYPPFSGGVSRSSLRIEIESLFGKRVLEAVDSLTKPDDMEYMEYIEKLADNIDAIPVKMADLEDNMNILGTGKNRLSQRDFDRLNKYLKAYRYLEDELRAYRGPVYAAERQSDMKWDESPSLLDETQKEHIRRGSGNISRSDGDISSDLPISNDH